MKSEKHVKKNKRTNTYLWMSLQWYWFLVATFYFLFILPKMFQADAGLTMESADVLTLVFQVLNYILSGLMLVINPLERSKTGGADIFLKITAIQQFLVGNIFGMLLTVLVWYRLPYKVKTDLVTSEDKEKFSFKPKNILIISAVNLIATIVLRLMNLK